jgi:hypothetical protein
MTTHQLDVIIQVTMWHFSRHGENKGIEKNLGGKFLVIYIGSWSVIFQERIAERMKWNKPAHKST